MFTVEEDISIAQTIDKKVYTDNETFNLIKEKVFASSWQLIKFPFELKTANSLLPKVFMESILEEPILLVSDENENKHCLSNVCTHRGNILVENACKGKHIVCPYHGRKFNLQGKFGFMSEFKEVKNFPTASDDLHVLPYKEWNGFGFTSLNPSFDFTEIIEEMEKRMSFLDFSALQFDPSQSKEYLMSANWALYCDNYLEGFHIPFVHPDLNQSLDYSSYETLCSGKTVLQIGYSKNGAPTFNLPKSSPEYGKEVSAYYFWVFPNMMFNFYPWGLSVNIVKPIQKEKTKVQFLSFVLDASLIEGSAGDNLDKVEREDEEVVENVQKGLKSRFYNHGRYSVKRETGVHHFHTLLCKSLVK